MKLKFIAAAALAAAALAPAHATIAFGSSTSTLGTTALGGELFLVLADDNARVSYTLDLGIRQYSSGAVTGFFTSGQAETGASLSFSLANDSAFAEFMASSSAANRTWAVIAAETLGVPSLFSTVKVGEEALVGTTINQTFGFGVGNTQLGSFIGAVNGTGTHPFPGGTFAQQIAQNGSSFNRETDSGKSYWGELGAGGPTMNGGLKFSNANAFGTSAQFVSITRGPQVGESLDLSPVAVDIFDNAAGQASWTFGNASGAYVLSYSLAPVPEPETYALMLAGLVVVGRMARRRLQK